MHKLGEFENGEGEENPFDAKNRGDSSDVPLYRKNGIRRGGKTDQVDSDKPEGRNGTPKRHVPPALQKYMQLS